MQRLFSWFTMHIPHRSNMMKGWQIALVVIGSLLMLILMIILIKFI